MESKDENRIATIRLTGRALIDLLTLGIREPLTTEGLPADARFVYAHYEHETRSFVITVESATFDPVPEYVIAPWLMVRFAREGFSLPPVHQTDAPPRMVAPLPGDDDGT